ncbi:MAG TPA: hypothetical protein VGX92_08675 [Pyrinomonadaceae bacterium]|nr:hypothetical protein [Pyrinomonadaceae bacterium]
MNKLIRLITLSAMVATLALSAFALGNNTAATSPLTTTEETATGQGDEDAKTKLYKQFTDNIKTNQPLAYETAKEYLTKFPAEDQYTAYMKKWVAAYEKGKRKVDLEQLIKDQKFAEAYDLGKQILVDEPNDLTAMSRVSWAALQLSLTNKDINNAEASNYARRTLQLVEGGKGFEEGKPLDAKVKDEYINWLNSSLGIFALKTNPNESIGYFLKAAQTEGFFKKDPQTYVRLALAYQAGPYKRLSDDFEKNFRGKDESPESKAALENLNQVIDRIIDAYARAIALATDAKYATVKSQWTTQLTNFYKFRHNDSEAGMQELIAGVLSTPLPAQPTLAPTPTPATTTTTPATGAGTSTGTNGTGTTPTSPATATPSASQPATTTTPPSDSSTTATKPKPPLHHARRP